MKSLLKLMAAASTLLVAPAFAQVVTLPIINTPSGKTLAGGSVPIDSSGVEKGTSGNPLVMACPTCAGGGGPSSSQLPASLGAKTGAGSLSVVPNTDTPFPASQSGTWDLRNISGSISLPTGAATETTLSGMSGKLPASLGAKTGALSFSVVPNTDTSFPVTQSTASNFNAQVVGNVASGATDAGNPVGIGGLASNVPLSAVTTGQRSKVWLGLTGHLMVGLGTRTTISAYTNTSIINPYDASSNSAPLAAVQIVSDGTNGVPSRTITGSDGTGAGIMGMAVAPQSSAAGSIAPTTVQSASANALKSTAGNVYSINVVNSTTAGFIVLYDATATPSPAASLTASLVRYCMPLAASAGLRDTFSMPYGFTAGIQLLFSISCTAYNATSPVPIQLTAQFK